MFDILHHIYNGCYGFRSDGCPSCNRHINLYTFYISHHYSVFFLIRLYLYKYILHLHYIKGFGRIKKYKIILIRNVLCVEDDFMLK